MGDIPTEDLLLVIVWDGVYTRLATVYTCPQRSLESTQGKARHDRSRAITRHGDLRPQITTWGYRISAHSQLHLDQSARDIHETCTWQDCHQMHQCPWLTTAAASARASTSWCYLQRYLSWACLLPPTIPLMGLLSYLSEFRNAQRGRESDCNAGPRIISPHIPLVAAALPRLLVPK